MNRLSDLRFAYLPQITRFAGPFSGVPMEPAAPQEVVIQVSKEVEITHDRETHNDQQPACYPPKRI